jgi:hypothetical protein
VENRKPGDERTREQGTMAKGKKRLEERVAEQVKKLLPDGLVPDSYLNYVVLDNADISDTEEELLGNVKMQMYEETGYDIPMTRKEAEEYLAEELDEEQWKGINHDSQVLTSQIKMLEDSYDKTMLEMIKELPLIPASRIISSIVISYLRSHGQEISDERAEEITEDLIHSLNTSFVDMVMEEGLGEAWEDGDGPEIEFDWGEGELPFTDASDDAQKDEPQRKKRRSRITKFPGRS